MASGPRDTFDQDNEAVVAAQALANSWALKYTYLVMWLRRELPGDDVAVARQYVADAMHGQTDELDTRITVDVSAAASMAAIMGARQHKRGEAISPNIAQTMAMTLAELVNTDMIRLKGK